MVDGPREHKLKYTIEYLMPVGLSVEGISKN